jgi:RNA polymerase sigma-70 factor, ECF subfamily
MEAGPQASSLPVAPAGVRDAVESLAPTDPAGFERIMRQHNQRLFRLALGLVGEPSEAEDVLQEGYVRAFRGMSGFDGRSCLGNWLASIVRHAAIDHLRARRSRRAALSFESELPAGDGRGGSVLDAAPSVACRDDPEASCVRDELRARIEAAVTSLPAAFRAVFILREIQGMSVQETADCLGVPLATVKTRDHRARLLLRKAMGQPIEGDRLQVFEFLGARCDRIVARVLSRLAPA